MKILNKPIRVISVTEQDGSITPLKFQYTNERKEVKTVQLSNVHGKTEEKLGGSKIFTYKCSMLKNKEEVIFELRYEVNNCRWFLYKL